MLKIEILVPRLLGWFAKNARDLPWRHMSDPYAIWISEIMLQQTQVKTVIPYWERWMRELATIESVAHAPLDRVLKLWEGLGYYARARNLQKAARVIVRDHGGMFPSDFQQILALPGIGRYTAGAICSIAFNQPTPILDGNVTRVLARLFAIEGDPREHATRTRLWHLAERLVRAAASQSHPTACSHLNQSLMELGATVCTPRDPICGGCPVRSRCLARRQGRPEDFPKARARMRSRTRHVAVFVVRAGRRYLVRQRSTGVINGGLWEFPNVEVRRRFDPVEAARNCLGRVPHTIKSAATIKHTITCFRYSLHVFSGSAKAVGNSDAAPGEWRKLGELDALAFTGAHRKIVERLKKEG